MATAKVDTKLIYTRPDGRHIVQLGDMEIWDGADLALLRETLVYLHTKMRSRSFGVDMTFVKYVPSGFFGMLFDWHEKGVQIHLYSPQPQVAGMIWFRNFFHPAGEGSYILNPTQSDPTTPLNGSVISAHSGMAQLQSSV